MSNNRALFKINNSDPYEIKAPDEVELNEIQCAFIETLSYFEKMQLVVSADRGDEHSPHFIITTENLMRLERWPIFNNTYLTKKALGL